MDKYEKITFTKITKEFSYNECLFFPIILRSHDKFPKNVKWSCPRITSNGKYIGAICSNNSLYIWNSNDGKVENYISTKEQMLNFEFNPNNQNLILIFQDCNPKYLSIKDNRDIHELEDPYLGFNDIISFSFSSQGKYFALCADKGLFVWDVQSLKLEIFIDDYSKKKYLRNESLIMISGSNYLRIININSKKVFFECNLKRIEKIDDLQTCMLNTDNKFLYYASSSGVFKLNLFDKITFEVCKFIVSNNIIVKISDDCKKYLSTNMIDIFLYEEKIGLVNKFTFEKFNHITIDFERMLLLIIDDVSISLKNLELYGYELDKCNIYTFQNPKKFKKIIFTRNSENLLGIVNENLGILYECSSGKIIKVFNNNSKVLYYENCLVLTPKTSERNYISVKLTENSIYLFDSIKGIPLYLFSNFSAYEVKFDELGNFLLAGTTGGKEICRLWDLENPSQYYSYYTNDDKKNKNTCVCLSNDRTKIICQSINQNSIIFDADSKQILYEINLKFPLNQINKIISSNNSKYFAIIGKYNRNNICFIFEFNDNQNIQPKEISVLDNCTDIIIPEKGNYFITQSVSRSKIKDYKITIWKFNNNYIEKTDIIQKDGVEFDLLNDDKTIYIISKCEEGKFGIVFHLYDSRTYKNIGDLEYTLDKVPSNFIFIYLTTDLGDKIVFIKVSIQKE